MKIVNTASSIPKYLQICEWLRDLINTGRFKEGEKLPSEVELSKICGVNRNTLRQTISELVAEGLLRKERGVGTFIQSRPSFELKHDTRKISSFKNDFGSQPIQEKTHIIEKTTVIADHEVATSLVLGNHQKVVVIKRLRIGNNIPLTYEENYLPYNIFKEILDYDLRGSLYQIITETFKVKLVKSKQEIRAINFDDRISTFFNLPKNTAGFFMKNTTFDKNNIPVDLMYSYFRGDKYRLELELGEY